MGGGGGAHQTTTQQSSTVQTSNTQADKYYTFNVTQSGLNSADALSLYKQNTQQQDLYAALAGTNQATGGNLVIIITLLLFAALIFRR